MGLFSFVGDLFGGGNTTVSTSVNQTSTQKIDVNVNPQIKVGVKVDTAPIGKALDKGLTNVGQALDKGLTTTATVQKGLVIAVERDQQVGAEQTLLFQESFKWLQNITKTGKKYFLLVVGAGVVIWVFKK